MSAFIAAGPPSRVIEETIGERFDFILLEPVIEELERVLAEKLGFDSERRREVAQLLTDVASESAPTPTAPPNEVTGDPDDDLVLACAAEARVDILVSGDRRHLLPVGEHRGVRILTPQAFLAELRSA